MPADLSLIDHIVVRLFSEFQAKGKRRPPIKVIAAALGCPTFAAYKIVARLERVEAIAIPAAKKQKRVRRWPRSARGDYRARINRRRARVDEGLTSSP